MSSMPLVDQDGVHLNSKSSCSSGSDEASSEERLRKLFQACDRDGDGFIDSEDVLHMCELLNMDEAVDELLEQLEVSQLGRISFSHFMRCRMRLLDEMEPLRSTEMESGTTNTDDDTRRPTLLAMLQLHHGIMYQHLLRLADTLHKQGCGNLLEVINCLEMEIYKSTKLTKNRECDELLKRKVKMEYEQLERERAMRLRLEEQSCGYEGRITELHSVIAELRKKIEQNTIPIIREEDEQEVASNKSDNGASGNEDYANESGAVSLSEDLDTSVLRQTVMELGCKEQTLQSLSLDRGQKTHTPTKEVKPETQRQADILSIELDQMREERDRLKTKVHELQSCIEKMSIGAVSPTDSQRNTPTKAALACQSPNNPHSPHTDSDGVTGPTPRMAELKKLKTSRNCYQVLGSEITKSGLSSSKMAEHLSQSMQECSDIAEIIQAATDQSPSDTRVPEFELAVERLQSKIDSLKSQNDLLTLTLEESKAHCDRLTVLIGKYESNSTALRLAVGYSDQALEFYASLVALLDSDINVLLAKCQAAGLGSIGMRMEDDSYKTDVSTILHTAHLARRTAEHTAKQLLQRLDTPTLSAQNTPPWEDLSSNHTTSTTSSTTSSADTDLSKCDERRLRSHIDQLLCERESMELTMLELESVHIDPLGYEAAPPTSPEVRRLDLENAVLMQELMAMKEEKAEYKTKNYLMEKERASLQLQLSGKESQEKVYMMHIDHLKSEITDNQRSNQRKDDGYDSATPAITLAELRSHETPQIAQDLTESLKREKQLKKRVQELVSTLEKLSNNAEIRHQQSAEFVSDLKKANSALVTAFEKAKKKYTGRIKKLEQQMSATTQKYESRLYSMQQKLTLLEQDSNRMDPRANETSL